MRLEEGNKSEKQEALWALAKIDPRGSRIRTAVTETLDDSDPEVQFWAVRVVRNFEAHEKVLVPALIRMLNDRRAAPMALQTLAEIGPGADSALPRIRELLTGADTYSALCAAAALYKLTDGDPVAEEVLMNGLNGADRDPRVSTLYTLRRFGIISPQIRQALLQIERHDPDKEAREQASEILRRAQDKIP